jgi:hypothetical protein
MMEAMSEAMKGVDWIARIGFPDYKLCTPHGGQWPPRWLRIALAYCSRILPNDFRAKMPDHVVS